MIDRQVILHFVFEGADAVVATIALAGHDQVDVLVLAKVGLHCAVQQLLVQVWKTSVEAKLNLEASLAVHVEHLLDLIRAGIPEIQLAVPFESWETT